MRLTLPEHLELLLTGEPVLDVYSEGPWRVPGALAGQVYERARDLDESQEARSLRATVPGKFRLGQSAVASDLPMLTSYLCGVGAVRGGSRCYPELDFFGPFLPGPAPPDDRDPARWTASASRWRPPGAYIQRLARESDPDVLLVSACDKLHSARAIVTGLHAIGPVVWDRFSQHDPAAHLRYYQTLAGSYHCRVPPALSAALDRAVAEMRSVAA